MKKDYTKIIPPRFQCAEFEGLSDEIKESAIEQLSKKKGIYFFGDVGTGKTFMAAAIAKMAIKKGINVKFLNTGELLENLREEFDNPKDEEESLFFEMMHFDGILVLDDIGSEKISVWARERLYLIINKKYEEMLPIIFTSNCDLEILSARMGDRVSSRIVEMTEILHITGPDKRLTINK